MTKLAPIVNTGTVFIYIKVWYTVGSTVAPQECDWEDVDSGGNR
jgi:hypothetical protein